MCVMHVYVCNVCIDVYMCVHVDVGGSACMHVCDVRVCICRCYVGISLCMYVIL